MCMRRFDASGGKKAPFYVSLSQYAYAFNSGNYHYDRPWTSDKAFIDIRLADKAPADLCFSQSAWNDALAREGWEPLRPFILSPIPTNRCCCAITTSKRRATT